MSRASSILWYLFWGCVLYRAGGKMPVVKNRQDNYGTWETKGWVVTTVELTQLTCNHGRGTGWCGRTHVRRGASSPQWASTSFDSPGGETSSHPHSWVSPWGDITNASWEQRVYLADLTAWLRSRLNLPRVLFLGTLRECVWRGRVIQILSHVAHKQPQILKE